MSAYGPIESVAEQQAVAHGVRTFVDALNAPASPFRENQVKEFVAVYNDRQSPYTNGEENFSVFSVGPIRQPLTAAFENFRLVSGARFRFVENNRLEIMIPHAYFTQSLRPFNSCRLLIMAVVVTAVAVLIALLYPK